MNLDRYCIYIEYGNWAIPSDYEVLRDSAPCMSNYTEAFQELGDRLDYIEADFAGQLFMGIL